MGGAGGGRFDPPTFMVSLPAPSRARPGCPERSRRQESVSGGQRKDPRAERVRTSGRVEVLPICGLTVPHAAYRVGRLRAGTLTTGAKSAIRVCVYSSQLASSRLVWPTRLSVPPPIMTRLAIRHTPAIRFGWLCHSHSSTSFLKALASARRSSTSWCDTSPARSYSATLRFLREELR